MQKIKNILKERINGLLLIILAVLIVSGLSLNLKIVQSKNEEKTNATPKEGQILGETTDNFEESILGQDETTSIKDAQGDKSPEETTNSDSRINPEDNIYNNLKSNLKKYCGKNFNVKKCRDYLLEAKDAREKGARFKELYKKYHFEKKEEKKDSASADSTEAKSSLVITLNEISKSYETPAPSSISVLDLMDLLQKDASQNFSYHSSSGFVDKINDTGSSGNMSWMLYACKGAVCKLSSVGATDIKINDWDKIEWKYLDWTTMDWTTW